MRHWLGWMVLAAGLPCWLMGFAMELQVMAMLAEVSASNALPESSQNTTEWVKSTFWLGPYLVWFGAALVVLGSVLGISGLIWARLNDNVRTSGMHDRSLNP